VEAIGAANTLFQRDGVWHAENTDVDGFLRPLMRLLRDHRCDIAGRHVAVVGAGGAARAVVVGLQESGTHVWVANRTVERARKLVRDFGLPADRAIPLERGLGLARIPHLALIVQTTTVGMEPHVDGDPIANYRFRGTEIAYDIIYTPLETPFLRRAKAAGCLVLNGADMFDEQAARQFELFLPLLS
jgi:3-dehydroquinate dehydratase/shikimate dehydrogenase